MGSAWTVVQIQIQFPYCKDDLEHQTRILRPKVIEHFRRNNIMGYLPQQPEGDWDKIWLPLKKGDSIPLHGSSIQPDIPKLSLNYIVGAIEQKHVDEKDIPILGVEEAFDPLRHKHVEEELVKASLFTEDVDPTHWFPLFTSMNYCSQITTHREIDEPVPAVVRPRPQPSSRTSDDIATESHMQMAERFLHMMRSNPSRVKEDYYWKDIRLALYKCSRGGEDGLLLWMNMTGRHGRNPEECQNSIYS